jgi:hypothetical protein
LRIMQFCTTCLLNIAVCRSVYGHCNVRTTLYYGYYIVEQLSIMYMVLFVHHCLCLLGIPHLYHIVLLTLPSLWNNLFLRFQSVSYWHFKDDISLSCDPYSKDCTIIYADNVPICGERGKYQFNSFYFKHILLFKKKMKYG